MSCEWPQLRLCWPLRRRCRCACVRCRQNSADSRARVSRCRRRCRRSWLIVTAQTHWGVSRRASRCAGALRRLRWRCRSRSRTLLLLKIEDDGLGVAAEAHPLARLLPRSCRPSLCGGIDALLQHGVNRVVVLQLARADRASATDPFPVDEKPEARNREARDTRNLCHQPCEWGVRLDLAVEQPAGVCIEGHDNAHVLSRRHGAQVRGGGARARSQGPPRARALRCESGMLVCNASLQC